MPARMRLQRRGKKGQPFYHIVIADGRAPRDGRCIESIGTYNPLTIPATIEIDFNKALDWLNKGVQPSDTMKAILAYKGILYKNHLLKGIKKGALTEAVAEEKFQKWLKDKESKIKEKAIKNVTKIKDETKKRLEAEAKVKQERANAIAKKLEKESFKEKVVAAEGESIVEESVNIETKAEEIKETTEEEQVKSSAEGN